MGLVNSLNAVPIASATVSLLACVSVVVVYLVVTRHHPIFTVRMQYWLTHVEILYALTFYLALIPKGGAVVSLIKQFAVTAAHGWMLCYTITQYLIVVFQYRRAYKFEPIYHVCIWLYSIVTLGITGIELSLRYNGTVVIEKLIDELVSRCITCYGLIIVVDVICIVLNIHVELAIHKMRKASASPRLVKRYRKISIELLAGVFNTIVYYSEVRDRVFRKCRTKQKGRRKHIEGSLKQTLLSYDMFSHPDELAGGLVEALADASLPVTMERTDKMKKKDYLKRVKQQWDAEHSPDMAGDNLLHGEDDWTSSTPAPVNDQREQTAETKSSKTQTPQLLFDTFPLRGEVQTSTPHTLTSPFPGPHQFSPGTFFVTVFNPFALDVFDPPPMPSNLDSSTITFAPHSSPAPSSLKTSRTVLITSGHVTPCFVRSEELGGVWNNKKDQRLHDLYVLLSKPPPSSPNQSPQPIPDSPTLQPTGRALPPSLLLFSMTYNLGNMYPSDLVNLLVGSHPSFPKSENPLNSAPANKFDIIYLGFQESRFNYNKEVEKGRIDPTFFPSTLPAFLRDILRDTHYQAASSTLFSIRCFVFVRHELRPHVLLTRTSSEAVGQFQLFGNKGGTSVLIGIGEERNGDRTERRVVGMEGIEGGLDLNKTIGGSVQTHSFRKGIGSTLISLVNCHLHAHAWRGWERMDNVRSIFAGMSNRIVGQGWPVGAKEGGTTSGKEVQTKFAIPAAQLLERFTELDRDPLQTPSDPSSPPYPSPSPSPHFRQSGQPSILTLLDPVVNVLSQLDVTSLVDYAVFLGDLNYRLDVPFDAAMRDLYRFGSFAVKHTAEEEWRKNILTHREQFWSRRKVEERRQEQEMNRHSIALSGHEGMDYSRASLSPLPSPSPSPLSPLPKVGSLEGSLHVLSSRLSRFDQLRRQRSKHRVFFLFSEPASFGFLPTYRLVHHRRAFNEEREEGKMKGFTGMEEGDNEREEEGRREREDEERRNKERVVVYSNKNKQTPSFTDRILLSTPIGRSWGWDSNDPDSTQLQLHSTSAASRRHHSARSVCQPPTKPTSHPFDCTTSDHAPVTAVTRVWLNPPTHSLSGVPSLEEKSGGEHRRPVFALQETILSLSVGIHSVEIPALTTLSPDGACDCLVSVVPSSLVPSMAMNSPSAFGGGKSMNTVLTSTVKGTGKQKVWVGRGELCMQRTSVESGGSAGGKGVLERETGYQHFDSDSFRFDLFSSQLQYSFDSHLLSLLSSAFISPNTPLTSSPTHVLLTLKASSLIDILSNSIESTLSCYGMHVLVSDAGLVGEDSVVGEASFRLGVAGKVGGEMGEEGLTGEAEEEESGVSLGVLGGVLEREIELLVEIPQNSRFVSEVEKMINQANQQAQTQTSTPQLKATFFNADSVSLYLTSSHPTATHPLMLHTQPSLDKSSLHLVPSLLQFGHQLSRGRDTWKWEELAVAEEILIELVSVLFSSKKVHLVLPIVKDTVLTGVVSLGMSIRVGRKKERRGG
ncbi:hypothetical protein BLNAU_19665 [Blattamonas nauphoetae]|uniref:Inositol polyphosphate-related phosphatase domain-containing protein n=1 Tax=Blattamonas nauphoetae TaxID=2049346 RepID=A0ABQ9X0U4_9EUKA|nr:hypothetical protein BLNAU_19665 [Blattamonas nauphoetae]